MDQQGERRRDEGVNTLTVIATESYEDFAENLQKEIEADTGIRFGIVEKHQFASLPVSDESGRLTPLGVPQSEAVWNHLNQAGLIDAKGKIQDTLRQALKDDTLVLPEAFAPQAAAIKEILRKLAGRLEVKNADERRTIRTRQAVLDSEEFRALWDRIKHRPTYRVDFDNEALIRRCVEAIGRGPAIARTSLKWRKADLAIGKGGIEARPTEASAPIILDDGEIELPDILTDLQDRTQLTRRSLARILIESERLEDFRRNPQHFIEIASESINRARQAALVDGIRYQRIGDEVYYAQELFEQEELTGYVKNMLASTKSVYEHVVYDSAGVERSFAEELERNNAVKVYAKLPGWFKIPTPLGTYNPDWAILVETDGAERIYFVVETKGSLFEEDLRAREAGKIRCGEQHFRALAAGDNPARFVTAVRLDDVLTRC